MYPVGCGVRPGGGHLYLRVFLDADDGVSIDQCEAVSRPLSDALDEADPIQGSYVLEVAAPARTVP